MSVLLVCVLCLLFAVVYEFGRRKHLFFISRSIRGPNPLPLVGHLTDNWSKPWMRVARQRQQRFGHVYGIFIGLTPRLVISDPAIVKKMLTRDFAYFGDRITSRFEHPIEQKMLFNLLGEEWSSWRKASTPAFSPLKLKAMSPLFDAASDHLLSEVKKRMSGGEEDIEVRFLLANAALEVIASTGLGIEMNLYEKSEPMVEAIKTYFHTTNWKVFAGMLMPKWLKQMIGFTQFNKDGLLTSSSIVKSIIAQRRTASDEKRPFADFTSILMKTEVMENGMKRYPSDDEITANILSLFLAGFDSVAILMSSTVFMLARHPQVQQQVFDEVVATVPVTAESVMDMKYMDAVLNEVLRIYPPSTFNERVVTKEYDLNGAKLPVGLHVLIPVYNMHHDEENFPDAEKFDPNRFLTGGAGESPAFMPFGVGPRACPGTRYTMMETKIVLSRLIQEFEFRVSESFTGDIDVSETVDELLMPSEMIVHFHSRK